MMKTKEGITAILVIVLGFLVLRFLFDIPILTQIALGIGLTALIFPFLGNWILKGWFGIGEVLGAINGRILLSIIFFLFLTPIAWIYRLTTQNVLGLKKTDKSNFHKRNHKYTKKDLKNIW